MRKPQTLQEYSCESVPAESTERLGDCTGDDSCCATDETGSGTDTLQGAFDALDAAVFGVRKKLYYTHRYLDAAWMRCAWVTTWMRA